MGAGGRRARFAALVAAPVVVAGVLVALVGGPGSPRHAQGEVPHARTNTVGDVRFPGRHPTQLPLRHPPVVMVVFDELPLASLLDADGRIDADRYPAFARLAHSSLWFRNATAVHDSTMLAVPAILSGRYPRERLPADAASHPHNLFTLLHGTYELHVSEEATDVCPTDWCEEAEGSTLSRLAAGRASRFRRFVAAVRHTPHPSLWFKHVLLPHVPWQFFPSGRRYRRSPHEPIPGLNGPKGFGVPWLVTLSYERHLLQLGFADRLLGELLGRLRATGLWRRSPVVVVADHGIGFDRGRDRRTVTRANVGELAPVPLFVKLPGRSRGRVIDRHVETIDVLPTIAELVHLRAPTGIDGRSLLRPSARRRREAVVYHRVGTRLDTVGGRYVFRVPEILRRRAAAVRSKLALFGSGGGPEAARLFRIGPRPRLVGRPVSAFRRLAPTGRPAAIDQAAELRHVQPRSGFVPAEITGTVRGGRPSGGRLVAVAVNGTIAAVGRTFSLSGSRLEQFAAIVPERLFRAGTNEVRAFAFVRVRGGLALRRL